MALTNMQYDEIIRSYNRLNLENKRRQNERIAAVYEKIPRIQEINEEISSLSLETTKRLLLAADTANASQDSLQDFRSKLASLKSEKAALLKEYGFPSDYMEMHYHCPDCEDTGYINNVKCHCFKKAEIEILYDQSNIKNVLERENFKTFQLDCFDDTKPDSVTGKTPKANMESILTICHSFVDNFSEKERRFSNLLFFGETGVGKTFLTNCIAKELIEQSKSVIYLSAINFFDILSNAEFNKSDFDSKNKAAQISDCDLLIIDDLGTELSNAFTNSALFNIINERLLNKKSVIISTNLIFPELMKRYSERLTSRLTKEYTFLKIYGDDLRHKLKRKNVS
ncbi:MAG: ATP-binding protein [Lachnospiraceae bacterium]|nr:ATP-binding protein [Lachnospiraceae bacterium]